MASQADSDGSGCAAVVAIALAIAAVVAALISIAAIVDPFSWLPPVGEVWKDCRSGGEECELANRFPGFWWHAIVNLVYTTLVALLAAGFLSAVAELRTARAARFGSLKGAETYVEARAALAGLAAALIVAGAGPIVVAAI